MAYTRPGRVAQVFPGLLVHKQLVIHTMQEYLHWKWQAALWVVWNHHHSLPQAFHHQAFQGVAWMP